MAADKHGISESRTRSSNTLLALTASALAIPGMFRPANAYDIDATQLDYRYSAYREGDIAASKTTATDRQRYSVDTHQLRVATVVEGRTDLSADFVVETMSGASPWFVLPGANSKPVQVMSGATIHDLREAVQLHGTRHYGDVEATLLTGYSNERDYHSYNGGIEGSWSFDQRLNTLSGRVSYTGNTLQPTEGRSARFPDRINHATSSEVSGNIGYTRVIDADTQIQTSVSLTHESGFLSDPYKLAYAGGNLYQDERPDHRNEIVSLTRLRHYVEMLDAAVRVDYRFFHSDWKTSAHTVDVAWDQALPWDIRFSPGVRWYSQSQVFFYAPYYQSVRSDNYKSSDYRLSPYGALSFNVDASKQIGTWKLRLHYENYRSGSGYALEHVGVENPGLVKFQVFSLGVSKLF